MKKKVLSIALAAAMGTMMLAGCGGSGSSAASSTAASSAKSSSTAASSTKQESKTEASSEKKEESGSETGDLTGKKVSAMFFSLEGEFFSQFDGWMKEGLEAMGIEYTSQSSNMDDVTMIEQIENAVANGNDLIYVWATNGAVVHDACKAALDHGAMVYAFVQDPGEDARTRARGTDEVECGEAIVEMSNAWIDKNKPETPLRTLVFGNESSTNQKERSDAIIAAMEADGRYEIVEEVLVDLSEVSGQSTAENMFAKYGDTIDCIACVSGNQVIGVCAYLQSEANIVEDPEGMCIVGCEVTDALADLMKKGLYDGAAVPGGNPYENISVQIEEIGRLLSGDTSLVGGFSSVDIGRCTPDNLADFGY